jgi:osmotically-inducible protein OsmY
MTIASPPRSDLAIQTAVEAELKWTPDVDEAGIGVSVENGAVALGGEVDSFSERLAAKRAAERVHGVTAIVDNLVVHPTSQWSVTDSDIAKDVNRALEATVTVPNSVKAEIKDHAVTLIGQVEWDFQRMAARRAVQELRGVTAVHNLITLTPRPSSADTETRIRGALTRNALVDARAVHATVSGTKVILTGTVRSWAERRHAETAAWASPHVSDVDNRIRVNAS